MESMRELTDIELNEVAGGFGTVNLVFTSSTTSTVVGTQANTGVNGGVNNGTLSGGTTIGGEFLFAGNDFS
jgi:hypothetical protein